LDPRTCHRCGRPMKEATRMDYDFKDIKSLKLLYLIPIPKKVYLVCDNCYLGIWVDSRDLE